MTRDVLTETDEAALETHSASTVATWQEPGEKPLHVRTRIRAGAATTETNPLLISKPLCPA